MFYALIRGNEEPCDFSGIIDCNKGWQILKSDNDADVKSEVDKIYKEYEGKIDEITVLNVSSVRGFCFN